MMIDDPGYHLEFRPADHDEVSGPGADRGRKALRRFRQMCPLEQQPPTCRITIHESIPAHCGFGSGTQFELALNQGLWLLRDPHCPAAPGPAIDQLADWSTRGRRSAIGIHGFQRGGFLVDGGKSTRESPAPLIARLEIPDAWRVVLVRPQHESGLSGLDEQRAFAACTPMPESTTDQLCRLLLMQILPALAEADLATFGQALSEYGRTVGHYFSQSQERWIGHAVMQQCVEWIQDLGRAAGQSSWGPTIWILCADVDDARDVVCRIERDGRWNPCWTAIAAPRNHGADLDCSAAGPAAPADSLP
jgi:beta-RFAP synthase